MTTYHEPIVLDNLGDIQNKFLHYLDLYDLQKSIRLISIDQEDIKWLDQHLAPRISKYAGYEVKVSYSFLTIYSPNTSGTIHIDSNTLTPKRDKNNWAVNIPIYNCSQGVMEWYEGDTKLSLRHTPEGVQYTFVDNPEELMLVERKIIDKPTIVRINVPHSASNNSDGIRLLLSVRFNPDIRTYDY